jgi:penicillin V acylase-like amidase (Ntn superfamily)
MQLLVKNYPRFIYGMANLNLGNFTKVQRFIRGLFAKLTNPHFIEGPNANMGVTTVISSSNYPKNIYNMPLFEKK